MKVLFGIGRPIDRCGEGGGADPLVDYRLNHMVYVWGKDIVLIEIYS